MAKFKKKSRAVDNLLDKIAPGDIAMLQRAISPRHPELSEAEMKALGERIREQMAC